MLLFVMFSKLELLAKPPPTINPFPMSGLLSRTDTTSNVMVATYGAFAGKEDAG